jgi:hypothetical protein
VLHQLYNKAHIGCLNGRDEAEMRKLRKNIVLDRYMSDKTRGMSYIFVLVDHNIAYLNILNIVIFQVENDLDMMYMQVDQLLIKNQGILIKNFILNSKVTCVTYHYMFCNNDDISDIQIQF